MANAKQIMIYNSTKYEMTQIYEYLSGFTTRLKDKIEVETEPGRYYDTMWVRLVKQ